MISLKHLIMITSLSCAPICGMEKLTAWLSKPLGGAAPATPALKADAEQAKLVQKAIEARKALLEGSYQRFTTAQKKLQKLQEKRGEAGVAADIASDEYLEGSVFDLTAYSKVATAQNKRASLSAAYVDKDASNKEYDEALQEFEKARNEYITLKTGKKPESSFSGYVPPAYIPNATAAAAAKK